MRIYTSAIVAALLALASPASAETLTNRDVIELVKAGLGPDAVVAKIQTSATRFEVSTAQLLELKRQDVPDGVISAMLRASAGPTVSANAISDSGAADPKAPHASGIYLLAEASGPPHMERIDPTVGTESKTTGVLAYAFTYGIAPVKMKTVIPNASARVKARTARPIFYFYFNQVGTQLSGNAFVGALLPGAVTSPNEFSLVRLETSKDHREAVLGQFNITGMKSGVMDKARVSFSYDDVAPGVFKVTPAGDLPPGEYGFVYSSAGASRGFGGLSGARIFDFAVASAEEHTLTPPTVAAPPPSKP